MPRSRIFITYKRSASPDDALAQRLAVDLGRSHDVFIDRALRVGAKWGTEIENEIRRADFHVILLSRESVQSQMVAGEIETAYKLSKSPQRRPKLLPVRVAYDEPLSYPISAYLNEINWASWGSEADTPRIVGELLEVIESDGPLPEAPRTPRPDGEWPAAAVATAVAPNAVEELSPPPAAAQPIELGLPEGTMEAQSRFYVERPTDGLALRAAGRNGGVTIVIKGPRGLGKSSLLNRVMEAARHARKRVVFIDVQLFDRDMRGSVEVLFKNFCRLLTHDLGLEDRVDAHWAIPLGPAQLCTRYVAQHVLKPLDGESVLLAMDEVDTLFGTAGGVDFFPMLRAWHESRARNADWRRLDLALVTSTEPYHLIGNLHQSPFNVGEQIELEDFAAAQIAEANARHYPPPLNPGQVDAARDLLGGHPYLIRRALYEVAAGRMTPEQVLDVTRVASEAPPFGDHLRHHLYRLGEKESWVKGLCEVLRDQTCRDNLIFSHLHGAGLVRREGSRVVPRCKLYDVFFRERLRA